MTTSPEILAALIAGLVSIVVALLHGYYTKTQLAKQLQNDIEKELQ